MANSTALSQSTLYSAEVINYQGYVYVNVTPGKSGGIINILNDFAWISEGGYVDEVPYIMAKELELNFGQIIQNSVGILNSTATTLAGVSQNTDPNDPYALLYSAHETGFNYVFPHLIKEGESMTGEIHNKWHKIDLNKEVGSIAKDIIGRSSVISKALNNDLVNSGIGLEDIYKYTNTTPRTLKISFPLYNTLDEQSAIKNFDFVNLFSLQNLKMRTSFVTFIPPKIYVLESPGLGGVYMPAAYVKDFDVKSIGTTRFLNTGLYAQGAYASASSGYGGYGSNGRLIPEAYKVEITFEELYPASSNIMLGALGGNKVNVLNTTTEKQVNVGFNTPTGLVSIKLPKSK